MTHTVSETLLAIEIGGTKLQLALGDAGGKIMQRARVAVDPAMDADAIRREIAAAVRAWSSKVTLAAVGVGFGGPIDRQNDRIACSFHVKGWNDFPLGEWLHELTHAPVVIENDANVAALAEATFGAGRGANPVFYTNQGTGVGGGLVLDGKIYHGAAPGEAEFGHVRLNRDGASVQDNCSGRAVDTRLRTAATRRPDGKLAELLGATKANEAKMLGAALNDGDAEARAVMVAAAADLAFGLSHVVHLFHPETIVLGGGLSLVGEPWRAAVAAALPRHIMGAFAPGPDVKLAELGEDVVLHGALLLAGQRRRAKKAIRIRPALTPWLSEYVSAQKLTLDALPLAQIASLVTLLHDALEKDRQVFVFGNGGSAANASHFATDLGKGSSDKLGRRFRVISLNDNVAWLTALGNDYAYDDIFVRQLENYANPGDIALTMSVSGNSLNCIKALGWAKDHGLRTIALVGAKRGRLAEIAERVLTVESEHYGRVEDGHMGICHMLCYAFMEHAQSADDLRAVPPQPKTILATEGTGEIPRSRGNIQSLSASVSSVHPP